jgi:hypothetical protein
MEFRNVWHHLTHRIKQVHLAHSVLEQAVALLQHCATTIQCSQLSLKCWPADLHANVARRLLE